MDCSAKNNLECPLFVPSRYGWTGREFDSTTGLQFNRARYYNPATGQWTSQDPIGFEAGDSNLYRYVDNKTIDELDPSGLEGYMYPWSLPGSNIPAPTWQRLQQLEIAGGTGTARALSGISMSYFGAIGTATGNPAGIAAFDAGVAETVNGFLTMAEKKQKVGPVLMMMLEAQGAPDHLARATPMASTIVGSFPGGLDPRLVPPRPRAKVAANKLPLDPILEAKSGPALPQPLSRPAGYTRMQDHIPHLDNPATAATTHLTAEQAFALQENLQAITMNSVPGARGLLQSGTPRANVIQSLQNQLNRPRFRFIDQVPGGRTTIESILQEFPELRFQF
jgi:RHS repeat-associated protein